MVKLGNLFKQTIQKDIKLRMNFVIELHVYMCLLILSYSLIKIIPQTQFHIDDMKLSLGYDFNQTAYHNDVDFDFTM